MGKPGHPLDPRDGERLDSSGSCRIRPRRGHTWEWEPRRVPARRRERHTVARAGMDLPAADVTTCANRRERRRLRRVERRIQGQLRRSADRRTAGAAFDRCGVVCPRCGYWRRDVEQRHDDDVVRPCRLVGRLRAGIRRHLRQHALRVRHPDGALTHGVGRARARPTLGPSRFRAGVDNITHSFVGVAIAELARPVSATPDERRMLTAGAVIAANLPDIDLAYTWITPPPLGYLLHHRGYTHTVAGLLALAVALPLAMRLGPAVRLSSSRALAWLWGTVAINLIGHVGLDALNSYGVHPFY